MANILGIFTAIVLAIAAFVAMKNNERLENEISNRDTELKSLAKSQDRLKAAQEVLKQLPIDRAEIDAQAAVKTEEETKLKTSNDDMKSQIDSKTVKIESNRKQLDEIRQKISRIGNIRELAGKMKNMRVELDELGQSITDNEASLANLTAQNTATEADEANRKTELDTFSKGESLPSVRTRIRNIYPTWGFVTLSDGNNIGIIANSTLNIVRGDETVGRLLVTAVESRSATATIIPDSIGEDVVLMVGDRVVPGTKEEKKAAKQ